MATLSEPVRERPSAITLGTVQLGLPYGIHREQKGKPSEAAAAELLTYAYLHGITALDTAEVYGTSEEVIGKWIQAQNISPFLISKISALDHSDYEALKKSAFSHVERICSRLHVACLPVLMIHHYPEYAQDIRNMQRVFAELKDAGLILQSGISAYPQDDYGVIASSGFDAVQIPLNLFDWRKNVEVEKLADAGMSIYARSVFLQGLAFQKPDNLPERMQFCRGAVDSLWGLSREYGMAPEQMAYDFVRFYPGVESLVLGCRDIVQLEQLLQLERKTAPLDPAAVKKAHSVFSGLDERVVSPDRW